MRRELVIPATYEALAQITPFIESVIDPAQSCLRAQLALAVHELCANIVQHGYGGTEGQITLEAELNGQTLIVSVQDGAPNPYTPPAEIVPPNPLDLPESGWGMHIIHQVMDEVSHQRLPAGNRWQLTKVIG
ncbi:MAG: ATP-binding protein [Anaerolineae bacterium]|nr:ATP-binding protein [Anaerolineae bacterium]